MARPVIANMLRRSRAGPSGGGLGSPGGTIGNILDNVLATPLDAAINQTYANWDWMTRPYPGPIRPPWAGQFGKKPWPTLGGVPWRPAHPWVPGLQTLGLGLALQWMMQPPGLNMAANGFVLCCDAGLPILDGIRIESGGSSSTPCASATAQLCGVAGQLTGSNWTIPAQGNNTANVLVCLGMKALSGTRQTHGQIWWRSNRNGPHPSFDASPNSGPVPVEQSPGTVYAPDPDPYLPVDPFQDPPTFPTDGSPNPPAYPDDVPLTMPPVRTGDKPYVPTLTVIDPGVSGKPQRPGPPSELSGPVKERKLILAINKTTFIGMVLNVAGETVDFIECFYDALPLWQRRDFERKYGIYGKVTPGNKLFALWQRFDYLDWNLVVHNLAVNQLEDKFFGKIGQLGAVANRLKDATLGYGTGGLQLGYAM